MKRLIGLSFAVILGVTLTTVMLIPNEANALDANLTGTCEGLCVESGVLKHVIVQVKGGWTNTDAIALDILITATNACEEPGCIFHGRQIVPLSSPTVHVLSEARDLAMVAIEWDDLADLHEDQTYYVDIQVLAGGNPLGPVQYATFFPWPGVPSYGTCLLEEVHSTSGRATPATSPFAAFATNLADEWLATVGQEGFHWAATNAGTLHWQTSSSSRMVRFPETCIVDL